MGSSRFLSIAGLAVAASLLAGAAWSDTLAIRAATIETAAGDPIENGVILISAGRIEAVGTDVEVPDGTPTIEAAVVVPGFVNAATSLGISSLGSSSPGSNAHLRVADELYPHQDAYKRAARAGFTTLALRPDGMGFAGQAALVRTVADSPEEMLLSDRGPLAIGFRADTATKDLLKGALEAAGKGPSSDPKKAPIDWAVSGEVPTIVQCADAGEMAHLTELLAPHKKMKATIECWGADLYRIAEDLGKRKLSMLVPARITYETNTRTRTSIPRLLDEAGAKLGLLPAVGNTTGFEAYRHAVAEQIKAGLDRETALKAMTIHPAEMVGLEYRLGSIEAGKDANLVILTGDVFDARETVQRVLIEGETVYDAAWGGLR